MAGLAIWSFTSEATHAADAIVAYTITDAARIDASLTGEPGDAARGATVFASRQAGCLACHSAPGLSPDGVADGNGRAPLPLDGVGTARDEGALRLWLVAPSIIAPDTLMPSSYAAGQRRDPDDPLYNGPLLSAAEIEDLVAWLATLK